MRIANQTNGFFVFLVLLIWLLDDTVSTPLFTERHDDNGTLESEQDNLTAVSNNGQDYAYLDASAACENCTSRVMGGIDTESDPYWTVFLKGSSLQSAQSGILCTGNLIGYNWIITAARCLYDDGFGYVMSYLGFLDMDKFSHVKKSGFLTLRENFYIHPNFDANSSTADIALIIILRDESDWTLLPSFALRYYDAPADEFDDLFRYCHVYGWGLLNPVTRRKAGRLQRLDVRIKRVTDDKIYAKPLGFNVSPAGLCEGDSGSGLVCRKDGLEYLVAITSRVTSTCGNMMFTRLNFYSKWITETLKNPYHY